MLGQLSPSESVRVRRATQAELKTPLMPGRQADGAGSAVPDPRAERPDAARAGDPARLAGPPISEQIETARRERRVLARVCRAAWRLEQAGRERAWAHWPQPFAEGARSVLWPARGWSGRPGLPP